MIYKLLIFCLVLSLQSVDAQQFELLDSSRKGISFRGLAISEDGTLWVSGNKGTVGKSIDSGKTWNWLSPLGFEQRDFRDVEAISANSSIIMAIDSPGIILKTIDGGNSWKVVYENHQSGIFLDAITFSNALEGICVGDPMADGRLFLIHTANGGDSWTEYPAEKRPLVEPGEAMFAASGTNVVATPGSDRKYDFALVTGGTKSRLWYIPKFGSKNTPDVVELPIVQGGQTTGANSIHMENNHFMVVGGDFQNPKLNKDIFFTTQKRRVFAQPQQPNGYKSCIDAFGHSIVAVGTTGVDWLYSLKKKNYHPAIYAWVTVTEASFHVVKQLPGQPVFYMAGAGGKIGVLKLPSNKP